jgi:hypothetical protein
MCSLFSRQSPCAVTYMDNTTTYFIFSTPQEKCHRQITFSWYDRIENQYKFARKVVDTRLARREIL